MTAGAFDADVEVNRVLVPVDVDADFLVVPREPVTGDREAVLEKAAEYVLSYASQPVLSV